MASPYRQVARLALLSVFGLVLNLAGCTSNRVASELTTGLEWAGLRPHARIDSSARWQLTPGTLIAVEEIVPVADQSWRDAAAEGIYRVFQPPPGPDVMPDLRLRIAWPESRLVSVADGELGWAGKVGSAIPDVRGRVHIRLYLTEPDGERVVQSTALTVDPHWFSPDSARPDQIRHAFYEYAATLTSRR